MVVLWKLWLHFPQQNHFLGSSHSTSGGDLKSGIEGMPLAFLLNDSDFTRQDFFDRSSSDVSVQNMNE